MIYVLCMLAGAAVFMGGFFVGRSVPKERKAEAVQGVQADIDATNELQRQIANMYTYDGRRQT